MIRRLAFAPLALVAFSACDHEPYESETVTLKVVKDDDDPTYEIADTAEVSNVEWEGGEIAGMVIVSAHDVGWDDNRTPRLAGTVTNGDESTVECEMHRAYLWSSKTASQDLQLRCEGEINIDDVKSVSVSNGIG